MAEVVAVWFVLFTTYCQLAQIDYMMHVEAFVLGLAFCTTSLSWLKLTKGFDLDRYTYERRVIDLASNIDHIDTNDHTIIMHSFSRHSSPSHIFLNLGWYNAWRNQSDLAKRRIMRPRAMVGKP